MTRIFYPNHYATDTIGERDENKPKTLYEYDPYTRKIKKHRILSECIPEFIGETTEGARWRCRVHDGAHYHDFHGWDTMKAANVAEIDRVRLEISEMQKHLERLLK